MEAEELSSCFPGAENPMGFHNPRLTMETLNKSLDLANQAKLKAIEAQTGMAALTWQPPATAENAAPAGTEPAKKL